MLKKLLPPLIPFVVVTLALEWMVRAGVVAGYLVPGQSRATDPITHLTPCGFHDHNHEGNPAYGGTVTAVAR
jgi:hypothetical protein